MSLVLEVHSIVFRNLMSEVRQQRDLHLSKSTLLSGCVDPINNNNVKIWWFSFDSQTVQMKAISDRKTLKNTHFLSGKNVLMMKYFTPWFHFHQLCFCLEHYSLTPICECNAGRTLTRPSGWTGSPLSRRPPLYWWHETHAHDRWKQWSQ